MHNNLIVAIVDDDDSVRVATARLVRSLGWDARPHSSAIAFLASAGVDEVDCVISDIQMPGMTGLEMQKALCARRPQLPVIFITAFCTEAIRKQAMTSGAVAFLCKPVDGGQIEQCLTGIARGLARSSP